jgi:PKD domain-containing protein
LKSALLRRVVGFSHTLAFACVFSTASLLAACANAPINSGMASDPPPPQAAQSITVSISPTSFSVQAGQTQTVTATVNNDSKNQGVTWTLSGTGCSGGACGQLSATYSASATPITYTAPTSLPNPASVTLTATSVTDGTKSATAAVTLTLPPLNVNVAPSTASVPAGASQKFTATVQNDVQSKGVTWTLSGTGCSGASCGTLSATSSGSGAAVAYTAPATAPNPASVTITATSVSNNSVSASATITITAPPGPPIAVSVSPKSKTLLVKSSDTFTATVKNDAQNKGATWTLSGAGCSGASCGTISSTSSASGTAITYTAPDTAPNPGTVTLTATSVSDSTASASANITVINAPGNIKVSLSPKRGGLTVSQTLKFTASVQNDPTNRGVTWTASEGSLTNTTASSAIYHAPSKAGSYTVTATSVLDVTKSASTTIGVTDLAGMTTYHNSNSRSGVNSQEYALTKSNVDYSSFGKLFSCPVDGQVYPQPLWVANLNTKGSTHNVVFVATEQDTVYAFDADDTSCVTYWSNHLVPSGEEPPTNGDIGSDDIMPIWGIVGTPAIDLEKKLLYVVTKTKTSGTNCHSAGSCHQRLHALRLADGKESANGPVELTSSITVPGTGSGSSGGQLPFDPWHENQRPGLAVWNGTVYVSWASHEDQSPWHGWVMGFDGSNPQNAPSAFNTTPNGEGGGIWMSGGAPSIDGDGNLYVITGNGDFDGNTDFGDSFLKLSADLSLRDWMTPADQAQMAGNNWDLGAGGAAVLADLSSGPVRHLLIGGGKMGSGNEGELYLLNRDAMGNLEGNGPRIVQKFSVGSWLYATPAFWNNTLYIAGRGGNMLAYTLDTSSVQFNTTPSSRSSTTYQGRGTTPAVSSRGNSEGILWAIDSAQYGLRESTGTGPSVLHAYDATDLSHELWNSSHSGRDRAGNAVKFTVPTIANGKVYVGTASELDVYGLLP